MLLGHHNCPNPLVGAVGSEREMLLITSWLLDCFSDPHATLRQGRGKLQLYLGYNNT